MVRKIHFPSVMVPVLSNINASIESIASNDEKSRTRIPFFPATDMPATRARGMAIPNAQGQEITSTVTPRIMAISLDRVAHSQARAVAAAKMNMDGTK